MKDYYDLGVRLALKTAGLSGIDKFMLFGVPALSAGAGAVEGAVLSPEGERLENALKGLAHGGLMGAGAGAAGYGAMRALTPRLLSLSAKHPNIAAALGGIGAGGAGVAGALAGHGAASGLGVGNLGELEQAAFKRMREED